MSRIKRIIRKQNKDYSSLEFTIGGDTLVNHNMVRNKKLKPYCKLNSATYKFKKKFTVIGLKKQLAKRLIVTLQVKN